MKNRINDLHEKIRVLQGFESVLSTLKNQADWCGDRVTDDEGNYVMDEDCNYVFTPPEKGAYNYYEYLAYMKAIEVLTEYVDKM